MENILKNIRKIREEKDLSQELVAEKMGMSQSKYARFERGATKTDLQTIYDFAAIVEMKVIDIITYPEKFVSTSDLAIKQTDVTETFLQIKLGKEKKDQVMKIVFGENNLEIFNK